MIQFKYIGSITETILSYMWSAQTTVSLVHEISRTSFGTYLSLNIFESEKFSYESLESFCLKKTGTLLPWSNLEILGTWTSKSWRTWAGEYLGGLWLDFDSFKRQIGLQAHERIKSGGLSSKESWFFCMLLGCEIGVLQCAFSYESEKSGQITSLWHLCQWQSTNKGICFISR